MSSNDCNTPDMPGKWLFSGEWIVPPTAKPITFQQEYEVHTMPDGEFYFRVLNKSWPVGLLKGKWTLLSSY